MYSFSLFKVGLFYSCKEIKPWIGFAEVYQPIQAKAEVIIIRMQFTIKQAPRQCSVYFYVFVIVIIEIKVADSAIQLGLYIFDCKTASFYAYIKSNIAQVIIIYKAAQVKTAQKIFYLYRYGLPFAGNFMFTSAITVPRPVSMVPVVTKSLMKPGKISPEMNKLQGGRAADQSMVFSLGNTVTTSA